MNVFDAAGLGLFCVAGTTKAYEYGLGLTASATLGLATAVGGGVLRDVLANEVPSLLRWDRDLYAVPAIVGATMVALCIRYDALNTFTSALAVSHRLRAAAARDAVPLARAPGMAPPLHGGRGAGVRLPLPARCPRRIHVIETEKATA